MQAKMGAEAVRHCLLSLPEQCSAALRIGETTPLMARREYSQIVFCGLGGSALGGEFVAALAQEHSSRPFLTVRGDCLPPFVTPDSLCFALSYSGSTRETLACSEDARSRGCALVTVTAGGALSRAEADAMVRVPGNHQPRLAFFYLSLPLLVILRRLGLAPLADEDCTELYAELVNMNREGCREAAEWAQFLYKKTVVIWGSGIVARAWKNQINENAKQLAFCNQLPEAAHNELTGFRHPDDQTANTVLILLRDQGETEEQARRFAAVRAVLHTDGVTVREHWARGCSPLARQGRQIAFGMWVSYELALLNGEDPEVIAPISRFKEILSFGE